MQQLVTVNIVAWVKNAPCGNSGAVKYHIGASALAQAQDSFVEVLLDWVDHQRGAKLLGEILARHGNLRDNNILNTLGLETQDHCQTDWPTSNDDDLGLGVDLWGCTHGMPRHRKRLDKSSNLKRQVLGQRENMCSVHTDSFAQPTTTPAQSDETSIVTHILGVRITRCAVSTKDCRLNSTRLTDFKALYSRANF